MQASEFDLVGQTGTVLARLQPGPTGNGQLRLFDSAGTQRVSLAGAGALAIFDTDGTMLRLRAGYLATSDPQGRPPFNGVQLDANGTIDYLPASP